MKPSVVNVGCVCHIMSTCTQYGVKKLGVPVEEVLHDVFQHFQHSSKRRQVLQELREFTDTDNYKLVRHCSTRWLSLQSCVDRFLQQWPALDAYFQSHGDTDKRGSRVACIAENLRDPLLALTFRFLSFILVPLNRFNTEFQNGDSMVSYLHAEILRVIRTFMAKFVKTSVINSASDVTKVDYLSQENQHDDDLLAVGMAARTYLAENDNIYPDLQANFFRKVRDFYAETTAKMISKFPVSDTVLQSLSFLCPENRETVSSDTVVQLSVRLGVGDPDSILDEFVDFQLMSSSALPAHEMGMALDPYWSEVSQLKTPLQKARFLQLSQLAFAAMSLPHSNADPERCFSVLKKIQCDDRENLSMKTIEALLTLKFNKKTAC